MAQNQTIAAKRVKTKAEGLQLPLSTPAAAQAAAGVDSPLVKAAKPAAMPVEPAVAARKVEPAVAAEKTVTVKKTVVAKKTEAVKKIVRKTDAKGAGQAPALKPAAAPSPRQAQPAGKPSGRPGKTAGAIDPIAEGREMIAALESCGAIAVKGAESLGKEVASLARGSVQAQFALTEALFHAKTLPEALVLQGNFARESLGNMTEGFAKLTGMSVELTQTVMAPIHDRVRAKLT